MGRHVLEGKTIKLIELASDQKAARFHVDGRDPIAAKTDGDCCSNSWIEHVDLPAMGLPATVLTVSDLDLPGSNDNDPEHECLQVYGLKITTDKGDIVIDYRHSSNGYYGGELWWSKDDPNAYNYFYGGVFGQNVSTEEWNEIINY
jgi:hypothetical protein